MKIRVHFFDVRHGDAIVIEYLTENTSHWVVIDSNYVKRNNQIISPTYEFLKKRKVEKIDAVIITHLHSDHYSGLEEILINFDIEKVYIPPFLSTKPALFNKQIKAIRKKIEELINRSDDELLGKRAYSLAYIIKYLSENEPKVCEITGPENIFRLPFCKDPLGVVLLPLPKIKGKLIQMIESENFELDSFDSMNDASIVLSLKMGKNNIIFGADSTQLQWQDHQRQLIRSGVTCLDSTMLKAPHHGSKHNNTTKIYDYVLAPTEGNCLFVSAEGKKHPHNEIFDLINKYKMKPYCTGLAKNCLASNVTSIAGLSKVPKAFRGFISSYEIEDLPMPCQGDITIEVEGPITNIYNSTGNTCIYRPDSPAQIKKLM
ncbi:ComEC/Rec2 family competence protein [Fluoribacter dumoffii]|uniref:ComEC/Rec2 family competence protein n=1 Tax=Fluoribacter dumoffii TaxID=463 RepID=UPI00026C77D0|nr:MBL fold metallo-hydrolase [Fluoribacter dumoffii]